MQAPTPVLNRYTCLPIALDILYRKRITLLTPDAWEDRNDAYYLERYRDERRLRSILAICFSSRRETFHHWRVFASGSSGVCIEFDRNRLLASVQASEGYSHGAVRYHRIVDLRKAKPELEEWPFLKRVPFQDEREYRIIFESKKDCLRSVLMPINIGSVRKVTLSPWLPGTVAESIKGIIREIEGCERLNVNRSSLVDNAGWRDIIGGTGKDVS